MHTLRLISLSGKQISCCLLYSVTIAGIHCDDDIGSVDAVESCSAVHASLQTMPCRSRASHGCVVVANHGR